MGKLDGKVAVVTGAARGIGLEYALRLASLGADVAVCDRDLASAQEYQAEASRLIDGDLVKTLEQFGGRGYAEAVDVSDEAGVAGFTNEVVARFGRIDVVVCNAGGGVGDPAVSKASNLGVEQAKGLLDRNYFGTVNTIKAALPTMREQGSGKIITISSLAAISAHPTVAAGADYAIAKSAVLWYTRNLAQEIGPWGVTANSVAPGFVATAQWRRRFANDEAERLDAKAATVPLRRLATPTDCANVIEFLSTDLSDYVTGQLIVVDGGLLAGAA